jgi:hypothetical protein
MRKKVKVVEKNSGKKISVFDNEVKELEKAGKITKGQKQPQKKTEK